MCSLHLVNSLAVICHTLTEGLVIPTTRICCTKQKDLLFLPQGFAIPSSRIYYSYHKDLSYQAEGFVIPTTRICHTERKDLLFLPLGFVMLSRVEVVNFNFLVFYFIMCSLHLANSLAVICHTLPEEAAIPTIRICHTEHKDLLFQLQGFVKLSGVEVVKFNFLHFYVTLFALIKSLTK
jgi:hypothetical protein